MKSAFLLSTRGQNTRHGFTLLQTIIVIGLIAVLIVLLMPAFQKAIENSRQAKCAANLRQLGVGAVLYANEHQGWLPWAAESSSIRWWTRIQPYADPGGQKKVINGQNTFTGNVWRCPSTANNFWLGYGWNYQGIGQTPSDPRGGPTRISNGNKSSLVLMADSIKSYDPTVPLGATDMIYPPTAKTAISQAHRNGLNTLFLDGHVSWYSADTYYTATKTLWQ